MAAVDELRATLTAIESEIAGLSDRRAALEAELAGLGDRREGLEKAAEDVRVAIASLDAIGGGPAVSHGRSAGTSSRARRSSAGRSTSKRPPVTPEMLAEALKALGGSASVEQLVEKLELPDGRSLNGARRVLVDAGTISYEDRTYTLVG